MSENRYYIYTKPLAASQNRILKFMKRILIIITLTLSLKMTYSQNMDNKKIDSEIKNLTQELINNGTKYDLEYLENIYDDDLKFVRIDKENNIQVLTKKDNIDFFTELKNSGAEPLNNYAEFHYADNDGENGFIVLTRKMKQMEKEQEFLFNNYWRKINGKWKIIRETVFVK